MSQKAILQILILMSSALVGIVVMQVYFVHSTLDLNYEVFDSNVHAALNQTVARLEQTELKHSADSIGLDSKIFTDSNVEIESSYMGVDEINKYINKDSIKASKVDSLQDGNYHKLEESFLGKETQRSWKKSNSEKSATIHYERFFIYHAVLKNIPIEKRASMQQLATILKEELLQAGVNTPYVFSIYDAARDTFIHQVSQCSQTAIENYKDKSDYMYNVELFPTVNPIQAILYIDFPQKKPFVWKSAVFYIFSAFVFAGIILACLYYTVKILFVQKKLAEMKSDFLNNMTHEFKTPIATISLASDSIRNLMRMEKFERVDKFINIIKEENARMLTQVEKVLQMARIEKKELKLKLEEIDTHNLIEKAVENISLQVEKRNGIITTDLQATPATILADAMHFFNAVQNLLDNANKYSPETPQIHIATKNAPTTKGKGILISVSDKGLGISKEDAMQIFESFYRVSTGNLHNVKGFGLGLNYVKSITDAHGGTIEVQSELGKGSTFIMFMPYRPSNNYFN